VIRLVERILPVAAVDRIIRKAGGYRVSESAAIALGDVLEEHGAKISLQAIEFSKHAKRRTVTDEDIRLAVKNI
jgi:DNA-binding protein